MNEQLQRPVLLRGIQIGRVVDVILEPETEKPVGYEVRCEDGQHRFLPAATASTQDGTIEIETPFALLDTDQLDFYRERGLTLRTRRGPAA